MFTCQPDLKQLVRMSVEEHPHLRGCVAGRELPAPKHLAHLLSRVTSFTSDRHPCYVCAGTSLKAFSCRFPPLGSRFRDLLDNKVNFSQNSGISTPPPSYERYKFPVHNEPETLELKPHNHPSRCFRGRLQFKDGYLRTQSWVFPLIQPTAIKKCILIS